MTLICVLIYFASVAHDPQKSNSGIRANLCFHRNQFNGVLVYEAFLLLKCLKARINLRFCVVKVFNYIKFWPLDDSRC